MNESTVTCPKCGADIPLSEAVSHRLREQLEAGFEKRRRELNDAIAQRERKMAKTAAELEKREKTVADEVAAALKKARKDLTAEAARLAEEKLGNDLKDLRQQLEDRQKQLRVSQSAELELRKKQRELEESRQNLELEMARKLDAERGKIAEDAAKRAAETERLKLADKEQVIKGLQDQIAALKQRAEQGSMQLQGETLEITLEADLREAFRHDVIAEVKKGQRGADILQRVCTSTGMECGKILWEAKRARHWSADWVAKLKEDQRAENAEIAVLVTTSLPSPLRGIGEVDGVWVCEPPFAAAVAAALRHGLISAAAQRLQNTDRAGKMAQLYDHVCSVGFRQHVQALVETFVALQDQLSSEQRAFARQWRERDVQLRKAVLHTAELYGGVQGIAGREALPEIQSLQLTQAE